ncbi:MAG: hypothetical protein ACOY94_26625 [Bacillota bacterium]
MTKKTGKPPVKRPSGKPPPLPLKPVRWHILPVPGILAALAWLFGRRRWTRIPWRRSKDRSA